MYYVGPSTCTPGYYCEYLNDYYSQCLPGSNPNGTTTSPVTATNSTTKTTSSSTSTCYIPYKPTCTITTSVATATTTLTTYLQVNPPSTASLQCCTSTLSTTAFVTVETTSTYTLTSTVTASTPVNCFFGNISNPSLIYYVGMTHPCRGSRRYSRLRFSSIESHAVARSSLFSISTIP